MTQVFAMTDFACNWLFEAEGPRCFFLWLGPWPWPPTAPVIHLLDAASARTIRTFLLEFNAEQLKFGDQEGDLLPVILQLVALLPIFFPCL